jgi:hypothetical protein
VPALDAGERRHRQSRSMSQILLGVSALDADTPHDCRERGIDLCGG